MASASRVRCTESTGAGWATGGASETGETTGAVPGKTGHGDGSGLLSCGSRPALFWTSPAEGRGLSISAGGSGGGAFIRPAPTLAHGPALSEDRGPDPLMPANGLLGGGTATP